MLLLYVLLFVLIALVGAVVLRPLVNEVEDLASRLPLYLQEFQDWIEALPLRYSSSGDRPESGTGGSIAAGGQPAYGLFGQALVVIRLLIGLLSGALNGIFTLILALYLTADSKRILRYGLAFRRTIGSRRRRGSPTTLDSAWAAGCADSFLLSAIIGTVTLIGLSVLGVRYAVLLAIIAAIGEVVPMIGPIVSAVPAVIIAFIYSQVRGFSRWVCTLVIQQLENNLIVPKVMERAVSLHPLAVMLALLAGGGLFDPARCLLPSRSPPHCRSSWTKIRRERIDGRLDEATPADLPPPGRPDFAP